MAGITGFVLGMVRLYVSLLVFATVCVVTAGVLNLVRLSAHFFRVPEHQARRRRARRESYRARRSLRQRQASSRTNSDASTGVSEAVELDSEFEVLNQPEGRVETRPAVYLLAVTSSEVTGLKFLLLEERLKRSIMRSVVPVLLLAALAALAAGSHFRGTTISWRPDENIQGLVCTAVRLQSFKDGCSYRFVQQCDSSIRIPVEDPDGDTVKCRWGVGLEECGEVCGAMPNVTLDEDSCTLSYAAGLEDGWYAIALVLEDFSPDPACSSGCGPYTGIPLQFLALVESTSTPCNQRPMIVGDEPRDQSCVGVPTGDTYTAVIQAQAEGAGVTYIRFFNDAGTEVHAIDTSSSDLQLSGNTLSFTTAPNVFAAGGHYILVDQGVVMSPSSGCATGGPAFAGISDSSTWTFNAKGYDYQFGIQKCLHLHRRPMTYLDARAYCQSRGGGIFQLDDAADVSRVKAALAGRRVGMWVGLTDEVTEGTFVWEAGTALASGDFTDWAGDGFDHNGRFRHCVQMKRKFQWRWVVRSCRRARSLFFCQP
uniref:C-type lectin domain-containing protein n=1 Tax=Branchiostoma floridae TaxID=7739 RepID=C3ZAW7_BRAFL|eukprot:XP_002593993.1 hypothetical protein BRAFLDRAFT_68568 [Branchiostoma floridae]